MRRHWMCGSMSLPKRHRLVFRRGEFSPIRILNDSPLLAVTDVSLQLPRGSFSSRWKLDSGEERASIAILTQVQPGP
eukprot:m.213107 g.213107  ORF g.213107 m.213107 type:complete len:77 (-) comp54021_c0_seq2:86-316(-)